MSALQIPYEFIEKYVRFSDPQAIRIYLYLRARTESDGHFPDLADAAAALNLTAAQLRYHLDYWISCGEIQTEGDSYTFSGGTLFPSFCKKQQTCIASISLKQIMPVQSLYFFKHAMTSFSSGAGTVLAQCSASGGSPPCAMARFTPSNRSRALEI